MQPMPTLKINKPRSTHADAFSGVMNASHFSAKAFMDPPYKMFLHFIERDLSWTTRLLSCAASLSRNGVLRHEAGGNVRRLLRDLFDDHVPDVLKGLDGDIGN